MNIFHNLMLLTFLSYASFGLAQHDLVPGDSTQFVWQSPITINDAPQFQDHGVDARSISPGKFGSQFARLLKARNGQWLAVYTVYRNDGYLRSSTGGTQLEIAVSKDEGSNWHILSTLSDPGRDLDNGQLVQLEDDSLVLVYRSVVWQSSYRVETRKSLDGGETWTFQSTIDANEGNSGDLGNPDKGVYEPYLLALDKQNLAVMYASEKYVTSTPSYSQVISMKISVDGGNSWGEESFPVKDRNNSAARPGMPVWTKMANGSFALVYELCETDGCRVWLKTSLDGRDWGDTLGVRISHQLGAPFIASLEDGRLVVTSNSHEISISRDYGKTWFLGDSNPWRSLNQDRNLWPSVYQINENKIAVVTSKSRSTGGTNIQMRYGNFEQMQAPILREGHPYVFEALHSEQLLDVRAGSFENGGRVQQWPDNNLDPQRWFLERQRNGSFKIRNVQSRKLLEVAENFAHAGALVQQWEDNGCSCQQWYLDYQGGGNFLVRAKHSGLVLDVSGGSVEAGAPIQQWTENGARPQMWKISETYVSW